MPSASWMAGSDVATTCTSRMAMNMPTHMATKPSTSAAVAPATPCRGGARPSATLKPAPPAPVPTPGSRPGCGR